MSTANNTGFRARIETIWPQWWRLSSAWLIVILTIWLLPGDLLNEWIGGPGKGEVVELLPWLVLPPTSALIMMLIFNRADSTSALEGPEYTNRMPIFVIVGLLLFAFIALMIVFGFTPGPKMKTLFWSLLGGGKD